MSGIDEWKNKKVGIAANSTIDHGVRVVDIGKFISTDGSWRKSSLGSTNCKTWKMNNI